MTPNNNDLNHICSMHYAFPVIINNKSYDW